ncbi:50S ribosomal protein L13 [Candidatus Saccharibacteria bacterium]|nr:50S ribosomal protein L13 [Candidatus Saccharibacteria bacterium]
MLKTFSPKAGDVTHEWYLIDAEGKTLGRLATDIAKLVMGKGKPSFSPHVDGGDNVVVINAAKIVVTGSKLVDKEYHRHSGYPGGLSTVTVGEQLEKHPTRVLESAVKGMLPKNRLQDDRMARLKIYPNAEHPHAGQAPKVLGDK